MPEEDAHCDAGFYVYTGHAVRSEGQAMYQVRLATPYSGGRLPTMPSVFTSAYSVYRSFIAMPDLISAAYSRHQLTRSLFLRCTGQLTCIRLVCTPYTYAAQYCTWNAMPS
ncbi:hypothetical protein LIA77_11621 [Sarocladium implicatum]|nr:hypothetical protein LIA77_11621 [Sarocladium implicatum]